MPSDFVRTLMAKRLPVVAIQSEIEGQMFDPVSSSIEHGIAIVFYQSRALTFSLVYQLAKSAKQFQETLINKKKAYTASFDKRDRADLSRASIVLSKAFNWSGTMVFINGSMLNYPQVTSALATIDCYLTALKCDNKDAHCLDFNDASTFGNMEDLDSNYGKVRYVIPCRIVAQHGYLFRSGLGTKIIDQVQAVAVNVGCDWCPYFDKNRTRPL